MKLLYFAWIKVRVGLGEEDVVLPDSVATVADLIAWLRTRSPGHAQAFADLSAVRAAVDQDFARFDQPIAGAVEVAFFPPVTGG